MRIIQAKKNKVIPLGFQGENGVVTVQFDVTGWSDLYGVGVFTLMNQRPTEDFGYPCPVTISNNIVSWVVASADVYIPGNGRCQLDYKVNQKVAKSIQFITSVYPSVGVGDVPDPAPDWVQEILDAISSIEVATIPEIDSALYG